MGREIWLLIGHGSRDREGNDEFAAMVDALRKRNPGRIIDAAFVEQAEPGMRAVLESYGGASPKTVWILPLLLFGAGHSKKEIPEAINQARALHPEVDYRYGTPLGIHPSLIRMIDDRVTKALRGSTAVREEETAILLIGRGSSDPDANGDFYKLGRLYWEAHPYGWVETCFIGATQPDLPAGLRRCIQLGAKRVIAVPYFIFTGVLIKRIERILREGRATTAGPEILIGEYLGLDPLLFALIEERFEAIGKGPVLMNCDLCKVQFPELGGNPSGFLPQSQYRHGERN